MQVLQLESNRLMIIRNPTGSGRTKNMIVALPPATSLLTRWRHAETRIAAIYINLYFVKGITA
jgi:hypothetical protein